jgi:hypothetical protein
MIFQSYGVSHTRRVEHRAQPSCRTCCSCLGLKRMARVRFRWRRETFGSEVALRLGLVVRRTMRWSDTPDGRPSKETMDVLSLLHCGHRFLFLHTYRCYAIMAHRSEFVGGLASRLSPALSTTIASTSMASTSTSRAAATTSYISARES